MTKQMIERLIGTGLGIVVGILMLSIGFWKTLLLVVLAVIGWVLSSETGVRAWISEIVSRLRSSREL